MSPNDAYLLPDPPSTLMHLIAFAPELSATTRFVSSCIIVYYILKINLFRLLNYFNKSPSLILAEWSCFHYLYHITDSAFIFLVVSHILLCLFKELLIYSVLNSSFDGYHDGFVHLIAYY